MSARGEAPGSPDAPDLTYAEALAAIESRGRYGIRLGLGRVRALLRAMGDPQLAVRGALVAGTNGKGSVIALAGSALRAAGYRVGETPKPHLVTYRERIVVDGRPIDAATFARLVGTVLPFADRIAPRLGPPTEFELLTAVMFRHFAEAGLDVALVEVGLGGRLDATHAWDGGVAVLTNVGLDHTDRLGPTVTAIAREKAAIVERGDVAVTGATGDGLAVIRRRCARLGVPLTVAGPAPVLGWDRDTPAGLAARARTDGHRPARTPPGGERRGRRRAPRRPRGGGHRPDPGRRPPARVRDRALAGPPRARRRRHAGGPAGGAARRGAQPRWRRRPRPGARGPPARTSPGAGRTRRPRPSSSGRRWPTRTSPRSSPRSRPARRSPARPWCARRSTSPGRCPPRSSPPRGGPPLPAATVREVPDPDRALDLALATGDGPVVVAGSLYLVGAARARLVDDPLLRDPVAA